jgi:hypothetical protein
MYVQMDGQAVARLVRAQTFGPGRPTATPSAGPPDVGPQSATSTCWLIGHARQVAPDIRALAEPDQLPGDARGPHSDKPSSAPIQSARAAARAGGIAMYGRVTRGRMDPARFDAARQGVADTAATVKQLPGCQSFMIGGDRASGRIVAISTWDTALLPISRSKPRRSRIRLLAPEHSKLERPVAAV